MFMVLASNRDIVGCMGIRWVDKTGGWDIYNVIGASSIYKGKGVMSYGLGELIRFALNKRDAPIELVVLKDNPAVGWYERNGFTKLRDSGEGIVMCFKKFDLLGL
jgi:ribosomal protein S18 acetylase RimI-like enzyme